MKAVFIVLLALVVAVGCGKKEPELRSEKVITPDEAANELFVEAVELVSEAQSKEATDINASVKGYEAALVKVREITNKYKKSSLAVKFVSDEALLKGKTMAQIEERADELQREMVRRAEEGKEQPKFIVINILKDGRVTLRGDEVKLESLEAVLKREHRNDPDAKVLVRGHVKAHFGKAADVFLISKNAGFLKATIGYDAVQ